ncbi:MAG: glycosyltransferase family 25 protein [Leptolyngbyaceae cyanobacterium bins.349]|nr:glycosyltransferase family 25 protein [Leptolyngbyaceae cyanobacterium bins.349]
MKILDFFQRGYVINLPERTDRRKGAAAELNKLGLSFTPGKLELFAAIRPTETGGFPSIGAHGCFLSHLQILKQARAEGLANVLIMEDDLFINRAFKEVEASVVEQLSQQEWDMVYFGDSTDRPVIFPVQFNRLNHDILTTTFYGVNASVYDQFIHFLETLKSRPSGHPDGGPMHLDGAYNVFRCQNPEVIALQTNGGLVAQRSSRSDIYPNAWYENMPMLRPAVELVRKGKMLVRSRRASLR